MTGFARHEGVAGTVAWVIEIRGVNNRGLDIRFRTPPGFDAFDAAHRPRIQARFARGSVQVGLSLQRQQSAPRYRLNREVFDAALALVGEIEAAGAAPPRLDALLSIRGVVEQVDDDPFNPDDAALMTALAAGFEAALEAFATARESEGARLRVLLTDHLDAIAALTEQAAGLAAQAPERRRARLKEQVDALLTEDTRINPERLEQEVAILLVKGDIREELDRLAAHVAQAREHLAQGGAVGRKLDFLCQEFNREANTLCSKSDDLALTRIGLDLKARIDQLREQVQNLE